MRFQRLELGDVVAGHGVLQLLAKRGRQFEPPEAWCFRVGDVGGDGLVARNRGIEHPFGAQVTRIVEQRFNHVTNLVTALSNAGATGKKGQIMGFFRRLKLNAEKKSRSIIPTGKTCPPSETGVALGERPLLSTNCCRRICLSGRQLSTIKMSEFSHA